MKRLSLFVIVMFWPALVWAIPSVQMVESNGITAWLLEDDHVPAIEVRLVFKDAGYISDPKDRQGRSRLAAAMLLEGADERDTGAFHRALEEKAITLSARSGRDTVVVSMQTLSDFKDDAFALLADMLLRPQLDPAMLEQVKSRFEVRRIQQEESPSYLAGRAFKQAVYGDHPYAQSSFGTAESMGALTVEDLQQYLTTHLSKANLTMSVVGDVSADELAELMAAHLADIPTEFQSARTLKPVVWPEAPFEHSIAKKLPQTTLLFAKEGIDRHDPNFYAAYVLNHIIGGGSTLTSRLGEEVRKKRGLTYGISTMLESDFYADRWFGYMATKHETATEAKETIEAVLQDVAANGVKEDEVQAAKDYITGSFPLNIDSNRSLANYLVSMQLNELGQDYLQERNALFNTVTTEQVNALIKDWVQPEQWSWVLVGPQENIIEKKETKDEPVSADDR